MKKIVLLLLAVIIMLSLTACGGKDGGNTDTASASQTEGGAAGTDAADVDTDAQLDDTEINVGIPEDIDFASIMAGNGGTDIIWGLQDEATKQQLIAEAKRDGVDLSFGADGSMTVVDPESGDTIVQNPDGTWTIVNDDGTVGQLGGNWPENEFTALLPKPDMEILVATSNEYEFVASFNNAAFDMVKAYVEEVKAMGFTLDALESEQAVGGDVYYTYEARNADGYTVTVSSALGTSSVILVKP